MQQTRGEALRKRLKGLQLPSDKQLQNISVLLEKKLKQEEFERKYAPVKEVLVLLGKGFLLTTLFMAPGAGRGMKFLLNSDKDWREWKKFNPSYLKRTIKRLQRQKVVKIEEKQGQQIVKITNKGKRKILKYAIDELELDTKRLWDGKWRIVIYDIPVNKTNLQPLIRETLRRLKFLKLQKSIYLTPYPCKDEIEFLREYYGLAENIQLLTVGELENEQAYRDYFEV